MEAFNECLINIISVLLQVKYLVSGETESAVSSDPCSVLLVETSIWISSLNRGPPARGHSPILGNFATPMTPTFHSTRRQPFPAHLENRHHFSPCCVSPCSRVALQLFLSIFQQCGSAWSCPMGQQEVPCWSSRAQFIPPAEFLAYTAMDLFSDW